MSEDLYPVFQVEIAQGAALPAAHISTMLATVAAPRPNQSVTVRDLPAEFAAEIVYLTSAGAPTHRVTYQELAQSWAACVSARRIDGPPHELNVGFAALVVDVAAGHIELERGE